jgi:CBS domain-containing protein
MSPRAACRLATLGFEQVYDYMPSKVDWMARGLPLEGEKAGEPRAIDIARRDVVTCRLDDTVSDVRDRVSASPYGFAFVTTADGVLLGRLRKTALDAGSEAMAGQLMQPGPSTTRPDLAPAAILDKLRKADLTTAVLSDPEGRLMGIVRREGTRPTTSRHRSPAPDSMH